MLGTETTTLTKSPAKASGSIRLRDEIRCDIKCRNFTHFVTLSTNDPLLSVNRAKERLKAWDARMNSAILGRRWDKKHDERIVWFAFIEGVDSEIHWHLLVDILPDQEATLAGKDRYLGWTIRDLAAKKWKSLVPSGSSDTQSINELPGAVDYITKSLNHGDNIEHFMHSRMMRPN